ncbi:MAG: hypothetical protein FWH20_10735 [Oscillospiraceae bacterium]|nr:hypothetical protein [Oscillospiraceae bacterium]
MTTDKNQPNTTQVTEEALDNIFEEIKVKFERKQRFQWKAKPKFLVEVGRAVRFAGGNDLDVIINGMNQGKLKAGKSVVITVEDPEVEVLIKALGSNPLKGKFRVEKKAYIEVGVWKNNIIFMGTKGAEPA